MRTGKIAFVQMRVLGLGVCRNGICDVNCYCVSQITTNSDSYTRIWYGLVTSLHFSYSDENTMSGPRIGKNASLDPLLLTHYKVGMVVVVIMTVAAVD